MTYWGRFSRGIRSESARTTRETAHNRIGLLDGSGHRHPNGSYLCEGDILDAVATFEFSAGHIARVIRRFHLSTHIIPQLPRPSGSWQAAHCSCKYLPSREIDLAAWAKDNCAAASIETAMGIGQGRFARDFWAAAPVAGRLSFIRKVPH